jgi:hypothetical protein
VAFVTSGTRDATSTDIQDYHDFVASQAAGEPILAALGTTWKAIAATDAAQSARTNSGTTGVGTPIYLLDGSSSPLVNSHDDLWDGTIDKPFNVDQHGVLDVLFRQVWTGSDPNGLGAFGPSELGFEESPLTGSTTATDTGWIALQGLGSTAVRSMYAVSGPLTAVPEPSSAILCLGLVGLGLAGRRRLKNSK